MRCYNCEGEILKSNDGTCPMCGAAISNEVIEIAPDLFLDEESSKELKENLEARRKNNGIALLIYFVFVFALMGYVVYQKYDYHGSSFTKQWFWESGIYGLLMLLFFGVFCYLITSKYKNLVTLIFYMLFILGSIWLVYTMIIGGL